MPRGEADEIFLGPALLLFFGLAGFGCGMRLLVDRSHLTQALFGLDLSAGLLTSFLAFAIPALFCLFAECLIGRGWRSLIRRTWQAHIAVGILGLAILVSIGRQGIHPAYVPYRILVIAGQLVLIAHVPSVAR